MANSRDDVGERAAQRGFAAMDQERQREIARKGGQSVPNEKRSFSQDRALAAAAGRKGGQSVADDQRSFSQDRALAAEAGRKGGLARSARARGDDADGSDGVELEMRDADTPEFLRGGEQD